MLCTDLSPCITLWSSLLQGRQGNQAYFSDMKKGLDPAVLCGIIGNVVSVVGVVLCNKYVINTGFRFTMVLSGLHFAATWLGCF
eukprot:3848-Eustigmatos_ZCMA.PRE.1